MESKVVRRRGRPNRGGGRFNRGRGRGRGRGGPVPQQAQASRGQQHGHGGRKGGSDFMADYEDGCSDGDYDYSGENMVVSRSTGKSDSSNSEGARGRVPNSGRAGFSRQGSGTGRGSYQNRNPVKVTMQHLQMSSANQELVKDMLRDLHGDDIELNDEDEYNELDYRAENQYWMVDRLKIEDTVVNAPSQLSDDNNFTQDITVSSLAVNKLERYGFHKSKATEALQICDNDIGLALEYLLSECFGLAQSPESTDIDADIIEQREDEMMALMSIYEENFSERIKSNVWVLKLPLSHLKDITKPKSNKKEVVEPVDDREVCRNYLKGVCRYGQRCRRKHEAPVFIADKTDSKESSQNDCEYELEIRFPSGNKYPKEVPFVAFSTVSSFTEKHICLNITKHLIDVARTHAENSEPCIFMLVNELENEDFLNEVVKLPPHEFSCASSSKPWLKQHSVKQTYITSPIGDTSGSNMDNKVLGKATDSMLRMTDNQERLQNHKDSTQTERIEVNQSSSKEESRKQNPAELLKTNRKLIDEFKRKKDSQKYMSMQEVRQKLPAWDKQDELLEAIESNQVVVISGMTGCGKTTQVPQFVLDLYLSSGDLHLCNILCTQPRRISAIAVAERVAQERAESVGRAVGYQIRLEKMQSSMTRLLFCTTGIVLRRLEGDTTLDGVTHLILDEVHERSEESDFLLMYLRDMLPQRPDLKIILMSATMNADLFSHYFGGCPVVDIPGRTFPVEQYFLEDAVEFTGFVMEEDSPYARPLKYMNAVIRGIEREENQPLCEESSDSPHIASNRIQDQNLSVKQMYLRYPDYRKSTVKTMAMIDHTKINFDLVLSLMSWLVTGDHTDLEFPERGAILVFMPGYAEIQTLYDMLLSNPVFGHRNKHRYKIIPLHSTLSSEDQQAVFAKPPPEVTKIVIATNIAETSITIDDICFVIDAGKMKEKRYDSTKGMESLETVWVSKANALQRKGRAGRVRSGVCFHLFTSHRYEHHLMEQPIPEIKRAPLEQIVLRIRMLEIFKETPVKSVLDDLPEPPSEEAILTAINRLETLGALDKNGELTPLGYHLGTLPVDVRIGKLMLFGAIFRCLDPALTIAACLSFKSPFVTPFGKKVEATAKKLEFAVGNSDHLTMMNAYNQWLEARRSSGQEAYRFCQDNFLSQRSLQMLSSMKQQFVELLSDIGFVREGISTKDVEKAARITGGDGVPAVTGEEANLNGGNMRLVSAILVGALYPNIVQVLTPEQQYAQTAGGSVPIAPKTEDIRFKTKQDGYIKIHPSSVNFQVRYYESPYLVYHEKVKTTRIYVRDCTMVSVYPLLLFGGGQIDIDLSRGNFILSVDEGWIRFRADSHQVAELVRELRLELDQLLTDKIENPHMDLCACPRGSKIISTIVRLITTQ